MSILKRFWAAAAAAVLLAGSAVAQQAPTRAVYVTAEEGNPKVYHVTGVVPQVKVPTPAPAMPVETATRVIPAPMPPASLPPAEPTRVLPSIPIRNEAPVVPAAPAAHHPVEAAPAEATCVSGHCGKWGKHGPTSFFNCACTPATVPPPLGSSVRGAFDMQRDNALGEYFTVYREDWLNTKFVLNGTGERHVDGIIRRLGMIGAPVKVEPSGIAELDAKRVTAIVERMVQAGVPATEAGNRVTIGTTRAEGLRFHDIPNIYNKASRGNYMGGGAGGGGGMFGGGFGGGFGFGF